MKITILPTFLTGLAALSIVSPLTAEPGEEAEPAKRTVTAIDHADNFRDAWIGYSDGTLRYCLNTGMQRLSGSATLRCKITEDEMPDSPVTAIGADGKYREAWVGYENGALFLCQGRADFTTPSIKCTSIPE